MSQDELSPNKKDPAHFGAPRCTINRIMLNFPSTGVFLIFKEIYAELTVELL